MRLASELVWSRNCDSCEEPKNSFSAATTGRMLMIVCGVIVSTSSVVIRSRTTRSIRYRPTRNASWISSPTVRRRRLPKSSYSSSSCAIGARGIVIASAAKSFDSSSTPSWVGRETSLRTSARMSSVVSTRTSSGTFTLRRWLSLYRPTLVRS